MTNYKTTTHFNDIDNKEKLSRLSSSLTDPDTISLWEAVSDLGRRVFRLERNFCH